LRVSPERIDARENAEVVQGHLDIDAFGQLLERAERDLMAQQQPEQRPEQRCEGCVQGGVRPGVGIHDWEIYPK
jgi:hypothetical protein